MKLTLWYITFQNGQTLSKNFAAFSIKFLEYDWLLCIQHCVKGVQIRSDGKYRLEKTPSLDTSPAAKGQTNIELRMGVLRANFSASSCPAANSLIIQVDFVVTII